MTQLALARQTGLSRQTVSGLLSTERITKSVAERVAGAVDSALTELVPELGAAGRGPLSQPPTPYTAEALPRELRAETLRFEAECVDAGADDEDLRYIRSVLHSPETATLFAGGYDGKPMTAEEARLELDSLTDALRHWLRLRIQRRQEAGKA